MANFNIPYKTEREGQMEFFDNYGIPYNDDTSILIDNTDGVYNGNIFEFKLAINNLNKTLFQAVKYLSKLRIKGESVPATILLVDLNATTVYVYKSEDYKTDIQKVYTGAASKDNEGFICGGGYNQKLNYSNMNEADIVKRLLKGKKSKLDELYLPIDIDENCIVGWAERYYREKPNASKGDFLGDDTGTAVKVTGEIRDPRHFKGLINPYTGEKFKYLMDCLNDRLNKKDLGAFYTPKAYCEKASELVMKAVERVPDGNDYVIIDRCAGTGNLEAALIGKFDKNGDELISHCVVSTYEYYEYKVLSERIGDKVRNIIPPTEANVTYENGKVSNADAMSEEFIENAVIKNYVNDAKCTIILFENPPYRDSTANNSEGLNKKEKSKLTFISEEYRKKASDLNEAKASARELSNLFIWSGFEYYLRQETDSYIIFSPVKYFKNVGLVKKKFLGGFLGNRKYFHATDSSISCMMWGNIDEQEELFDLPAYDIINDKCIQITNVSIRKAYNTLLSYYDKRKFKDDVIENNVWVNDSGYEVTTQKVDTTQIYNPNIIGILGAKAFAIDVKSRILVRGPGYFHHGVGFVLRSDNYKIKLPLWVAKSFPQDNWYEKDVYNTTSDGGDAYTHDNDFLKSCLIYTCLSNQNKCLSFDGSDSRYYRNELCFDTTNGDTVAAADLKKMPLDADEKDLVKLWDNILNEAKKTANYDCRLTYGVYQITKELNTSHKTGTGRSQQTVYDYPTLNGYLETLRTNLKAYYKSHITNKMFRYELLK